MTSATRQAFNKTFNPTKLKQLFHERIIKTRAVGRDGVRTRTFEQVLDSEIALIVSKSRSSSYKFTRYREKLASKGAGKLPRVLSIPTVRDRLALRALCEFLALVYKEAVIKKPHSYIREVKDLLRTVDTNSSEFLRLDIENYYGTINKAKLLKTIKRRIRIPEAIYLITEAIKTPTIERGKEEDGIPQGLSISNILAAVYLMDCDEIMSKSWKYYRYVDDILIVCRQDETAKAHDQFKSLLKRKGLRSHDLDPKEGKSYVASLQSGVDYLGFNITPAQVSIRRSSYRKMFATIGSVLTEFRYRKQDARLVWRLNLKISGCRFEGKKYGWMFFFLQTDNLSQLARLDRFVRLQLKERGLSAFDGKIKRFIKAYHEIRYNLQNTAYIPDFDHFSIDDKRMFLREVRGTSSADLSRMSDQDVNAKFFSAIRREVGELEKDLLEAQS